MPGIVNAYFRIGGGASNVPFMNFDAAAGYAVGVFRNPADAAAGPFTGLVRDGRVRDVSGLGTVSELLANWDDALVRLDELAAAGLDDAGPLARRVLETVAAHA